MNIYKMSENDNLINKIFDIKSPKTIIDDGRCIRITTKSENNKKENNIEICRSNHIKIYDFLKQYYKFSTK